MLLNLYTAIPLIGIIQLLCGLGHERDSNPHSFEVSNPTLVLESSEYSLASFYKATLTALRHTLCIIADYFASRNSNSRTVNPRSTDENKKLFTELDFADEDNEVNAMLMRKKRKFKDFKPKKVNENRLTILGEDAGGPKNKKSKKIPLADGNTKIKKKNKKKKRKSEASQVVAVNNSNQIESEDVVAVQKRKVPRTSPNANKFLFIKLIKKIVLKKVFISKDKLKKKVLKRFCKIMGVGETPEFIRDYEKSLMLTYGIEVIEDNVKLKQ
ncbi:hypothetical protein FQR65_LT10497 [Abscondita terminalis]|nr:hypothetical protein FQR65_LT10497 [Abscondita terminalis]